MIEEIGILVPVSRPEERVREFVQALASLGFAETVIVLDGSEENLVRFGESLESIDSVTVLRHFVPRGRGAAIRTGVNHFGVEASDARGVVIVDPDEDLEPADVRAVADALRKNPESLIIGVRREAGVEEPADRVQNLTYRWVSRLFLRRTLRGVPAGLRGIPAHLFPSLLVLTTSGREYDLDVLIESSLRGVPFEEVTISGRAAPAERRHRYRPLVESLRTVFVFPRFITASLITAGIDLAVFTVLYLAFRNILLSMAGARLVAGTFNYVACRSFVFRSRKSVAETLAEYVLLVAGLGTISYAVVTAGAVVLGANIFLMKIGVEAVLFVGNFAIQQGLIFPRPERTGPDAFTDWDGYYDRPFPASTVSRRITGRLLARFFALREPREGALQVTELGGADSCFYTTLRERFRPAKYWIVDTSRAGHDRFRSRHPAHVANGTVELREEDVRKLDVENVGAADVCFSVGLIEHFAPEELEGVVRKHFDLVRDGGLVIISFPVPTWLYTSARSLAERFGLWKFPDETPLERERVRSMVEKHGTVLREKVLWPILFTQCMMAVRKDGRAEAPAVDQAETAAEAPSEAPAAAPEIIPDEIPESARPAASEPRKPSAGGTCLQGAAIVAGMVLAAVGVAYLPAVRGIAWPFWMTVGGGFLAALGLAGTPARADSEPADLPDGESRPWLGLVFFVLGFVVAALGSSILAADWNTMFRVLPIWAVGLSLMAAGLNRFQGYRSFVARLRTGSFLPGWTKREILILLAITAFAVFLRVHRLDYFPPPDGVMAVEEPQVGKRAWMYMEQGLLKWEFLLGNLLTIGSFKTFGLNYFALRFPPILLSILTIPVFYLLMRELVGFRARIAATLLFAAASWHLIYARVAHGIVTPVPVSVLFFYFLIRTRTRPRLSSFVWLGATIAILMTAYAPFRLVGVIALLFYLVLGVNAVLRRVVRRIGRRMFRRANGPGVVPGNPPAQPSRPWRAHPLGLLLTFVVAAELFFPIGVEISRTRASYYFEAWTRSSRISHPEVTESGDRGWSKYSVRLGRMWGVFHIVADTGHWGIRKKGKLDPVTGTMFVLALGYLIIAWYRGFNGFFLLMFLLLFHGLGLLAMNFDIRRFTGLVPLLFVLVGLWLGAFEAWFMHRLPRWRILLTGLMAVAVAAAGVINWDLYFRKYITAAETRTPYVSYHSTMAGVLSRTEPGRPVIVISPRTFGAAQRKTDYVWLIPEDLESYGARNRNELFEILGEMIPGTEVVLLIQGPGNLDEWEAELRDLFHCGPFKRIENPDNPRVEIRRSVVTIPAELPGIEDQAEGVEEGPDSPNLSPDEEMVPPPSTGEDRGAGNSPGPPIVE